jgi:hypothetical protein
VNPYQRVIATVSQQLQHYRCQPLNLLYI